MKASYIRNSFLKTINSMCSDPSAFVIRPGIDFSRNRKCSFRALLLLILSFETHSLNREIRRFFHKISLPVITKSAFIQQRQKLNDLAFPFLFSELNAIIPSHKTFRGYHLLACDGSDVNVPPMDSDPSTRVVSNTPGVDYHQFHLNAVFDILEERYTDLIIQPRAEFDERKALLTFLYRNTVPGKSLFLADRGYFSINVLAHLLYSGCSFLFRVRSDDTARSFFKRFELPPSEELDLSISFSVTRSRKKKYRSDPKKYVYIRPDRPFDLIPLDDRDSLVPMSFRLVKVKLPNGESEFLVTNLPAKKFSAADIKELYHMRWGIETSFRFLKYNVALNSFHSIRRDFIIQEIYARVILYNFTMMIVHNTALPERETKYPYKISVSDAVVTCRDFLIQRIKNEEITELLCRYLTDIRPGRTYPRKSRSKRYTSFNNRA